MNSYCGFYEYLSTTVTNGVHRAVCKACNWKLETERGKPIFTTKNGAIRAYVEVQGNQRAENVRGQRLNNRNAVKGSLIYNNQEICTATITPPSNIDVDKVNCSYDGDRNLLKFWLD